MEHIITSIMGMGLSDLVLAFAFLVILKLEIKIVLKIIGLLICLEVVYLITSGIPPEQWFGCLLCWM